MKILLASGRGEAIADEKTWQDEAVGRTHEAKFNCDVVTTAPDQTNELVLCWKLHYILNTNVASKL